MKTTSTIGWAQHAVLAFVLLALNGICFSQPRIAVEKTKVDLGVIYNGSVARGRVVIRNIGRDSLKIVGVTTSCGCTTVKRPKDILRPGEQDAVEIEFNSTGYRGKFEKHVDILSNDPKTPATSVTLLAEVVEELQPVNFPSVIWLGAVPVGKEVEQIVGLKNISGKVITVLRYDVSSPDLRVALGIRTILPADTLRFTIKITPNRTEYINELLLLETDSNKQTKVPVRVTMMGVSQN